MIKKKGVLEKKEKIVLRKTVATKNYKYYKYILKYILK